MAEKKTTKTVTGKTEEIALKNEKTIASMDPKEMKDLIDEDRNDSLIMKEEPEKKPPAYVALNICLIVLLVLSLVYFGVSILDKEALILSFLNHLLLTIFTIIFVAVGITYNRRKRGLVAIGAAILGFYFLVNMTGTGNIITSPIATVENFSGKNLTYVMKWAEKNSVQVNQEYEYSDMIDEYMIISQDVAGGTRLKDVQEITVSVSEGPNPSKEIVVPSMITWDSERVINFIKENYMSNVIVEFTESDKAPNTVIEQSTSGNLKRDDELRLIFSYGETLGFSEVTIPDFTGRSKFEVEFFMKQHQLRYDFAEDFDTKLKQGYAIKQSHKTGTVVKVNDEKVTVTISKGPKIVVPDFTKYSMEKVTDWAIQNKLKLKFTDQYDDTVKENNILSANYKEGDIIEQGTTVQIVLSRGPLKMPKFKTLTDFYNWADKYSIPYEEVHEFHDSIPAGEVIRYSYKTGEAIKNNDTIRITISDGSKKTVPNVKGLTKDEAASKIEKAGLNYSFVYRNSNDVEKGKVINQSIASGSEVSGGTTVTVTISNGPSSGGNTPTPPPTPTPNPTPTPEPEPEPTCDPQEIYIYDELISIGNASSTCSKIKGRYPNMNFVCNYIKDEGLRTGILANGEAIENKSYTTCDTITLNIVNND